MSRALAVAVACLVAAVPLAAAPAAHAGGSSNDTPAPCAAGTAGCPSGDPFFTAPAGLAGMRDGTLVGQRTGTIAQPGIQAKTVTTITYKSEDTYGAAVLGSATVLLPTAPYTGAGTQPLVAFQFAEDSLGRQCAPSYALANQGANDIVPAESADVQSLLATGYDVVVPDAEGPAEQFIAGRQEGHAVLDALRAAETLLTLPTATRVAMMGYSGGAHSTGWAAELAGSYAPELNVVGTIEGGTPADLTATAKYNDGTATFGLVLFAAIGLDRAYPGAGLYGDLNAAGRAAYAAASAQCVQGVTTYAAQTLDGYTTAPDLIDSPTFQAILTDDRLGQAVPAFPIFNYHSTTDEIVPYNQDKSLVDYYCAHNVAVTHLTFTADHFSGEVVGVPPALTWLAGRFNGAPITNTCAATDAAGNPPLPPTSIKLNPGGGTTTTPTPALPESPLALLLPLLGLGAAGLLVARRRRA